MTIETYGYAPPAAKSHFLLILCVMIAVGAGYLAFAGQSGLVVAGFEIGPRSATFLHGAIGVTASAVAIEEARKILRPMDRHLEIRLDDQAIIAPGDPADPRPIRLSYKGISDIKSAQRDGDRFLVIKHIEGNIRIAASAMDDKASFDRLWKSLESRVVLHRGYRY